MALKDDLLKLKQEISSVGMNFALRDLNNDFVDKIEAEKDKEPQFSSVFEDLSKGIIFHKRNKFYSIVELTDENSDLVHLLEYCSEECTVEVPKAANKSFKGTGGAGVLPE